MKKIKIIVDILMLVLFILLIGYHLIPDQFHEYMGISLFVLFLLHNILNYRWYKSLFKGKYSVYRFTALTINFLLLISMILVIISSVSLSNYIFSFYTSNNLMIARKLHLSFTMWSFLLISIHLGFHLSTVIARFKKKIKMSKITETILNNIFRTLAFIIAIFGIYQMYIRNIHEEMFLLTEFKFYDYDKSILIYSLESFSISLTLAFIGHYLKKILNKIKPG